MSNKRGCARAAPGDSSAAHATLAHNAALLKPRIFRPQYFLFFGYPRETLEMFRPYQRAIGSIG
jgi:hypothetical protein